MDLKEEHILGDQISRHWYYRSKASALLKYLIGIKFSYILDVGAGSAFFSSFLLENTDASAATCIDTSYSVNEDKIVAGKPLKCLKSCDSIEADLVLMMDVLEHVDDDIGLVREYSSKVPNGTWFLITVPAFPFLWSGHDVYLEHKRRYTINQIEGVLRSGGLSVKRGSYFFGLIFPLAIIRRTLGRRFRHRKDGGQSDLQRHSWLVNMLLSFICKLELPMLYANRVAGLTIFCLAQKP